VKLLDDFLSAQYRRPSGILGIWVSQQMARDHQRENLWTIGLLEVTPTDHILEIGFGSGFAIERIAGMLSDGQIAGVDFSPTMVKAAQKRLGRLIQQGKIDLRHGDAACLPFPNESFNKAYSVHSIYFWPQPLKALQEIQRVLKPGGTCIITLLPMHRMQVDFPDSPEEAPNFKQYAGEKLTNLFLEASFHSARIASDPDERKRSNFSVIGLK
jgi:ubiquinone/menaquinone biosynthesis C-methylase UbiE